MIASKIDIIGRLLKDSTIEFSDSSDNLTCRYTEETDLILNVKTILKIAKEIKSTKEKKVFFIEIKERKKIRAKEQRVGMTKLGASIVDVFLADIPSTLKNFNNYQFHPLITLAIEEAEKSNLIESAWKVKLSTGIEAVSWVRLCNSFVEKFQELSNSEEFKKIIKNFERNSDENFKSFNNYIEAQFEKKSRLLFLRLDLGYASQYLIKNGHDIERMYRRIKLDWSTLHNDLHRKILKENFLGFVWKLEYGIKRSFHYHVLLIVDSSNIRADVALNKIIGDHWKRIITKNDGYYFNCNSKKNSYRFCGIGQIHRHDIEKRNELRDRVGAYLTKTDYVLALKTPDGGRSFGRGNTPQPY